MRLFRAPVSARFGLRLGRKPGDAETGATSSQPGRRFRIRGEPGWMTSEAWPWMPEWGSWRSR